MEVHCNCNVVLIDLGLSFATINNEFILLHQEGVGAIVIPDRVPVSMSNVFYTHIVQNRSAFWPLTT